MPQSLSQVLIHVVFSTKQRVKCIDNRIRDNLHRYIATILRDMDSNAYRIGGTANHIHAACTLPRTLSPSELVKKIKATSSKWIKKQGDAYAGFSWQNGYSIFSVSKSRLPMLIKYIDNQEEHHRETTFREEVLKFLEECDIDYDEEYLWG